MSPLSITLFGSVQAALNGRPVKFVTDKCLALLAYLMVEAGQRHRRDSLAGLLWPEHTEKAARTNLRQTLHRLRAAIGDIGHPKPHLLVTTQDIQLNPHSDRWLDVAEFERCLDAFRAHCGNGLPLCANCHEVLKTASSLYTGDFMAGFSLSASPSFELWLLTKQEQYRRRALEILGCLGGFYEAAGDFILAAPYARRLVALEPWRESSHRLLMRNLARAGQHRMALEQYEQCRLLLAEGLGVEPSAKTRQLYERIRDQDGLGAWNGKQHRHARSQRAERSFVQDESSSPAPFVGRENELVKLDGHLAHVLAGNGRVLFISGEAGSGKTILAAAFCRRAMTAEESLLVAYGRCDSQYGLGDPYQPFREALRLLTGQAGQDLAWLETGDMAAQRLQATKPAIRRALAEAGPDLPGTLLPAGSEPGQPTTRPAASGLVQTALFEQVTAFLRRVARSRPLILILDDLHWIDAVSASLLFHLGRHLARSRLLIVGLYRPEEADWFDRGAVEMGRHPLLPVVNGLRRIYGDIHVDLDQTDGCAFIEAYIDSEPNRLYERFRDNLYRRTGGNPLFTVEMLRGLQDREELVRDEAGCWVTGGKLAWNHLPARVEAVISERLERLTPSCQMILAAASVQGQTFLAEVAAGVQGKDAEPVIRCLSEVLGRQHYLVEAGSRAYHNGRFVSRFRFRHHLFQQFAYQQLDDVNRARLHEATGFALEALFTDQLDDHAAELARHFAAAGWVAKAANYLHQAGQEAYRLSAYQVAIDCFGRGLALLSDIPAGPERDRKELALQLALTAPLLVTRGYNAPEIKEAASRAINLA